MSHHSALRFKGYVKSEFREGFDLIATEGKWNSVNDQTFINYFNKNERTHRIPTGDVSMSPERWHEDNAFDLRWNKETGEWIFQCSLNYGHDLIENFFLLVPYFIEKIEHLEYFDEQDWNSDLYDLFNNEVICIKRNFKEYLF